MIWSKTEMSCLSGISRLQYYFGRVSLEEIKLAEDFPLILFILVGHSRQPSKWLCHSLTLLLTYTYSYTYIITYLPLPFLCLYFWDQLNQCSFLHKIQPLLEAQIYSTFCASPSHSERLITLRRDPSQEKKLELFHFHLINFAKFHDAIIQYAFAYKHKKSISYLFQLTQTFEGYESRGQSYFYPKWFSPKLLLLL